LEEGVKRILLTALVALMAGCASNASKDATRAEKNEMKEGGMATDGRLRLGNFSASLAVKDLAASRAFYEKLGFKVIGGQQEQNWLIMQNDASTIGLFQGMFKSNMMTFNPGWDRSSGTLPDFDDVREIQRRLREQGIPLVAAADENGTGPASLVIMDPDGNTILIDQHVPKPGTSK
jgi:catechol 2,3-dioxygenase-like lactoylglutathione lyase family enzyme